MENAKEQIRKTLEYMPQTEQDNAATLKLMDLIRKKKLQVKVYTKDQLHAKAYVFELDNRQLPIMGIVGSSKPVDIRHKGACRIKPADERSRSFPRIARLV